MMGQRQGPISSFDHLCSALKPYITMKYKTITIPSCDIYIEPQLRQQFCMPRAVLILGGSPFSLLLLVISRLLNDNEMVSNL